ncbi:hypothetical protein PSTEL_11265 [Paenibacillus stellifer]|uniref:dTDP-glucose 4,6-dehydratase n=1 Tax=Paenibacillus stellifer TaxID=169760 RepID=A0A089N4B0_9BACL|nr:dTDP-glucose 4,6-dehydratase [Paenibacillus stellifer]AIQ63574.1 hypothetical protein PSTEL_11265 [Paenibacillus stellifer]
MRIMVTGGAGFIGSNFLNRYVPLFPLHDFINVDSLTYAGNPENLRDIQTADNYFFEQADIAERQQIERVFLKYNPDTIIHFAAESHVDRSIQGPGEFLRTNIWGTYELLELARKFWNPEDPHRFHHVSTDEVFGSLGKEGFFSEETAYSPNSPYSASKASSDHLVRAYHHTYGVPVTITNCSNNYGPYQHVEKLIPKVLQQLWNEQPVPIYGDGSNVRDWLYVEDHCDAIWKVMQDGRLGDTYLVGGNNEKTNLELALHLCELMADYTGKETETYKSLITFVTDRPGHDQRYALEADKIKKELGWSPRETIESGLRKTVQWYLSNPLHFETRELV